jgi:acyl-coenzyme A synthetase/AMP-(fatty) acid ligase
LHDAVHDRLVPLSRLLAEGRAADCVVAFGTPRAGASVDFAWSAFEAEVAALAAAVRAAGAGRWALLAQDASAFCVGLLALWRTGSVAVLPPNGEEGTLSRLRADVAGMLSDRADLVASGAALHPRRVSVSGESSPAAREALDAEAPALELFTSGTAGASKPVVKALHQLEAEIAQLEAALGADAAGARVFATAAPHHFYGLLFRVLWPLCAGRAFAAETLLHAEEIVPRLLAAERSVLVGTPAHLRRLREHPALASLRGRVRAVFSSGGPLDADTAAAFADALGAAPIEVYGSTETGGIALRRQSASEGRDTPWTPFPPVRVARDAASGCARVSSPYLARGDEEHGVVIGDGVTLLDDGRIRLGARSDRVVKIGEKRLSLPDMEERLLAHPSVADAALTVQARGLEPRVAAVVVPSATGRAALSAEGRRVFARTLASHLARDFDRVLLPRAWRFVEEVPVDERGKRSQDAIAGLFAEGHEPPGELRVVDPEVTEERREAGSIERWLRIPEDLAYFEGHFPGAPVVPGVAQLRWALVAAEGLLGGEAALARLDVAKFKDMLRPGDECRLVVRVADAAGDAPRFEYEVTREGRLVSSGRGTLRPVAPRSGAS